jgi:dienelactone hydrolase
MLREPVVVITELHELLAAADVPRSYVLVGHCLGGTLKVLYARTSLTRSALWSSRTPREL